MKVRHVWEGRHHGLPIRVEQSQVSVWSTRLVHTLTAGGKVLDSSDKLSLFGARVRLTGETGGGRGGRAVVATVRGTWLRNARGMCTVTVDGAAVPMQVIQTRWLAEQPAWGKVAFIVGMATLATLIGDLLDNRVVSRLLLFLAVIAMQLADAAEVFPDRTEAR